MILSLLACTATEPVERVEPTFIKVLLAEGEMGSREAPLPFSSETMTVELSVELQDIEGNPYEVQGDLSLTVRPGILDQAQWVQVDGSTWSGEVSFHNGFGPTRIWFSDEGDKDTSSGRPASFATGVSDPMWFEIPTIGELNRHPDHETNQLANEFAELRAEDRDLRVSAVGTNGYWVIDLADDLGEHNSLFVYTFSRPDEEVEVGRRITQLSGNDQEYLATTQLSFPTYVVSDDEAIEMPEAADISDIDCSENDILEGYESSLVRLEDLSVPDSFREGDEEYEDYVQYGQWPVGSCSYYVTTSVTIPDFAPEAGMQVDYVEGMLSEIWGRWIITPRNVDDLSLTAGGPPAPDAQPPSPPLPDGHTHADMMDDPCLP